LLIGKTIDVVLTNGNIYFSKIFLFIHYCHWHSEKVMQILWCSGHVVLLSFLFTVQEVGKTVSQMRRKMKRMWRPKRKSCA